MSIERLASVAAAESLPAPESISPDVALVTVKNEGVPSLWWRLRKGLRDEGWIPVIAGSPDEAKEWLAQCLSESPGKLNEPSDAAFNSLLARRRREMIEEIDDPDMAADLKVTQAEVAIPEAPIRGEFVALQDLGNDRNWPEVAIAFIRTDAAWKIPHVLSWGGFNEAPHPTELALTLWNWEKRFGAIAAAFTSDTIELFMQKPIADLAQISSIAEEMVIISPDIVWQGTETTTALASEMANRHIWYMWWD